MRKPVFQFLITGDLHVHAYRQFSVPDSSGINSRLFNCLRVLELLRKEAKRRKIDKIILNGDILHDSDSIDTETYGLLYEELARFSADRLDVTINTGNHDVVSKSPSRLIHSLTALQGVARIIQRPTRLFRYLLLVPWEDNPKMLRRAIKDNAVGRHPSVAILHVGLREGRINASGYRATSKIGLRDISSDKFDLVLLSDYHHRQKVADHVYYLGSPLQHNFGETHEPCIWEIRLYKESPYYKRIPIPTKLPRFVKLEVRRPEEARRLFERHAGDYCQVRVSSSGGIHRDFLESEARRAGCSCTFVIDRAGRRLAELPRNENIEQTIQEYASSKKLARLGLEIFR